MQQNENYGTGTCYILDFGIYSTKNQHIALCFLVVVCLFFFFNFSLKVVLCFVHEAECSGIGPSLSLLCRKTRSWGRSEHSRLLLSCGWAPDGKSANGGVLSNRDFVRLTTVLTTHRTREGGLARN